MKFTIRFYVFLFSFILGISTAWSIPEKEILHKWVQGGINVTGPADGLSNSYLTVYAVNGGGLLYACNNSSITYNLAKVEYTPIATPTGQLSDRGGELFSTGYKGLIMLIQMSSATGLTPPNMNAQPLPSTPLVIWTGWQTDSVRRTGFRFFPTVTIFKGVDRIENSIVIPRQALYKLTCFDAAGVAKETNTIVLDEVTINANVTSCAPDTYIKTINMEGIPIANIENVSSSTLIATKQQTFGLKCDPNIQLKYSIVDLNDPTNRTTTSTLTNDSTARGVGYAITAVDGTRLKFGPDGSAQGVPDQVKTNIGIAGNAEGKNNPMSLQLGFSYVRKSEEKIKTGSAKSLIGITYSYQ